MFGRSNRPIAFNSYGSRRSGVKVPRWLVLLLIGIGLGIGGVLIAQERYLPPRLSAEESASLRNASAQAETETLKLRGEMSVAKTRLDAALADSKRLSTDLATARSTAERAQADLGAVVAALPPDPRGGAVEIRAAHLAVKGNALAYDVVLTRDRSGAKPMPGVMQFAVAGQTARGTETTVTLEPVALSIGSQEVARGSVALPDGFRPRQTTIQILDRAGGKSLGMRVMLVK